MIEFTMPNEMQNDELERVLTALEEIVFDFVCTPFVSETLTATAERHGKAEIHTLIGSYIFEAATTLALGEEPNETHYQHRAAKALNEDASGRQPADELKSHRCDTAHYHGQIATVCDNCGRVRSGLEWQRQAVPDDHLTMPTTCPDCEKAPDMWQHASRQEPTDAELNEWLGSVETIEV